MTNEVDNLGITGNIINPDNRTFNEKLEEMNKLLMEANEHYFNRGGMGKNAEGEIYVYYPGYWDQKEGKTEPSIAVYSYALGPHRNHEFETIDLALETVREWCKLEMENNGDL